MLRVKAPGTGMAGRKEPAWLGSSNSSPPHSSWKSSVNVLGIRVSSVESEKVEGEKCGLHTSNRDGQASSPRHFCAISRWRWVDSGADEVGCYDHCVDRTDSPFRQGSSLKPGLLPRGHDGLLFQVASRTSS